MFYKLWFLNLFFAVPICRVEEICKSKKIFQMQIDISKLEIEREEREKKIEIIRMVVVTTPICR